MNDIEPKIKQLLQLHLQPVQLDIINDSARHHGHAGDNKTGQSHFIIHITSNHFKGLTRVQQHQHVYAILAEFMPKPIHALQLFTKIP